ncbi:hypothetical protein [Bradyrhizobium retamae]|uniref:Uncharacterized protein n=1 Tax=Bradyrhizobium retamae TaxID=1300035 RepID=A0A0R3NC08_9BRAD|nr:hypothetical protein [Bradyrhizobium retamae]KRR29863.1 hypothetical protein CQ13_38135 [Bradyrhizobium retamae]
MIAPESKAFDDAVRAFNTSDRTPTSTDSADESKKSVVVTTESSAQATRSNIQAGISSHRVVSEPLSMQRKTTLSDLAIAWWTKTGRPNHGCHRYKSSRCDDFLEDDVLLESLYLPRLLELVGNVAALDVFDHMMTSSVVMLSGTAMGVNYV